MHLVGLAARRRSRPVDSAGAESDDAAEAAERHPLEHAQHGPSCGNQRSERASHMAQYGLKPHRVESFKISSWSPI
jgi:hypothetical protein